MLKYYVDQNNLEYYTGKITSYVDTQIELLSETIDGLLSRTIFGAAPYNNKALRIISVLNPIQYESASGLAQAGVNYYTRVEELDGTYTYILVKSGIKVGETDVSSYYIADDTAYGTQVPTDSAVIEFVNGRMEEFEDSVQVLRNYAESLGNTVNTIDGKVDNKVGYSDIDTSFPNSVSDSRVPSTKLVKNSLDNKLSTLVSNAASTVNATVITAELGNDNTTVPTSKAVGDAISTKLSTAVANATSGTVVTTITAELGNSHTTVPTSKAVKDVTDTKLSTAVADTSSGTTVTTITAELGNDNTTVPTSKAVKDAVDDVHGEVSVLSSTVESNSSTISSHTSQISSLETRVGTAETNISGKFNSSNIDTSIPAEASDAHVLSTKATKTALNNKLSTAVANATSGTVATTITAELSMLNSEVPTCAAVKTVTDNISTDVSTNAGNIQTNAGNISTLQSSVSTIETTLSNKVNTTVISTSITDSNDYVPTSKAVYDGLASKLNASALVTSVTNSDSEVPSAKSVRTALSNKLGTAVSGATSGTVATTITAELGSDHTTVPTSKAVKDVTDALSTSIGINTTNISSNADSITNLSTRVGNAETNINNKLNKTDIDTSIPSTAVNTKVPSTLLVKTELGNKLNTAVANTTSGTTASTITAELGSDHTTVPTSKAVKDVTDTLSTNIGTNTSNITSLTTRVDTAETNIGNKFDKSNINTSIPETAVDTKVPSTKLLKTELGKKLNTAVSGATSDTVATTITAELGNDHTTVPSSKAVKDVTDALSTSIGTNATNISTNANDIDSLESRMGTAETNISNKVDKTSIDTSFPDTAVNTNVPSSLLVKTQLGTKLSTAVAGATSGTTASTITAELGNDNTTVPTSLAVSNAIDSRISNKIVTSFPATTLNTNVPSTKLVKDSLDDKLSIVTGTPNVSVTGGIVTELGSDHTTVPTSKAVKDVTDTKLSNAVAGATSGTVATTITAELGNTHTSVPTSLAVANAISDVTDLIPSEASTNNQLADKNFVNSSISTSTATFRGTFSKTGSGSDGLGLASNASNSDIATALNTKISTKTPNDYSFVIDTDSSGHPVYKRFKYDGTTFSYEYSLNNSSFTSAQWAAINGTATKLGTNKVGSAINPIYLNDGVPTACTYTLGASVPSDALFTDTVPKKTSVTINTTDWSNKECVKSITGMNESYFLFVMPEPTSEVAVADSGVACTAQGAGTLTFECDTVPSSSVTFNILCFDVQSLSGTPSSLSVSGTWEDQFEGAQVNISGLNCVITYTDGTTRNITPSVSPSIWASSGTQTATFSYTEKGVTVTATKDASVIAVDTVLDNNSWSTIQKVARAGLASQYWNVGDTKQVSVSAGTVDGLTLSAGTYQAVIIGIDHNKQWENNNSIDFCIGNTSDGSVRIAFGSYEGSSDPVPAVRMNTSDITTGGWAGTKMYTEYLPAFYNLLSGNVGLQAAMIAPKKWTHNYESGSDNEQESYVTLTEDSNYKMFLMSEFEIKGTTLRANVYEQNKQAQYDYYNPNVGNRNAARFRFDSTSTKARWWTRSPHCKTTYTTRFASINRDSSASVEDQKAAVPLGIAPCFRIG